MNKFHVDHHNDFAEMKGTFHVNGMKCKKLGIYRRKRVIGTPVLRILTCNGPGKLYISDCEIVISHPNMVDLLSNCTFLKPIIIALSILEGLSNWQEDRASESHLTSPAFFANNSEDDGKVVLSHN